MYQNKEEKKNLKKMSPDMSQLKLLCREERLCRA